MIGNLGVTVLSSNYCRFWQGVHNKTLICYPWQFRVVRLYVAQRRRAICCNGDHHRRSRSGASLNHDSAPRAAHKKPLLPIMFSLHRHLSLSIAGLFSPHTFLSLILHSTFGLILLTTTIYEYVEDKSAAILNYII